MGSKCESAYRPENTGPKPGRQQGHVSTEVHEAIKRELQDKERALADLSVELAILRKKTNGGSWDR
jgi:hypothetical protein